MNRRVGWLGVVVAIAIGCALWLRRGPAAGVAPAAPAPSSVAAGAPVGAPRTGAPASAPPGHVIRLASVAERQEIARQIAAARAARTARAVQAASPPSSGLERPGRAPEDHHDLERAPATLKAALGEAIPFLAECYQTGSTKERRPAVLMTLVGDREVGTLIEPGELLVPSGKPLDGELASCLRTTLESLELPPLGDAEPLHIQYSFRFDD